MPAKSVADALLDRNVARADARDRYRAAIMKARQQLARDYQRADAGWIIATNQARSDAAYRRSVRARFREMGLVPLRDELAQVRYTLTPAYAVYMTPDLRKQAEYMVRAMLAELVRRGEDVS